MVCLRLHARTLRALSPDQQDTQWQETAGAGYGGLTRMSPPLGARPSWFCWRNTCHCLLATMNRRA